VSKRQRYAGTVFLGLVLVGAFAVVLAIVTDNPDEPQRVDVIWTTQAPPTQSTVPSPPTRTPSPTLPTGSVGLSRASPVELPAGLTVIAESVPVNGRGFGVFVVRAEPGDRAPATPLFTFWVPYSVRLGPGVTTWVTDSELRVIVASVCVTPTCRNASDRISETAFIFRSLDGGTTWEKIGEAVGRATLAALVGEDVLVADSQFGMPMFARQRWRWLPSNKVLDPSPGGGASAKVVPPWGLLWHGPGPGPWHSADGVEVGADQVRAAITADLWKGTGFSVGRDCTPPNQGACLQLVGQGGLVAKEYVWREQGEIEVLPTRSTTGQFVGVVRHSKDEPADPVLIDLVAGTLSTLQDLRLSGEVYDYSTILLPKHAVWMELTGPSR
jgi:hypothetical protein